MFFNSEEMPFIIEALEKERVFLQGKVDQDRKIIERFESGILKPLFEEYRGTLEKSLEKWEGKLEVVQGIFRRIEEAQNELV